VIWLAVLALAGLLTAALGARYAKREPLSTDRLYRISKVVDGDTLELDGRYKVRLIGVDTPEAYPCDKLERDAARCALSEQTIMEMGREATFFAQRMCRGRSARIEFDPANRGQGHRDKYSRYLAFVFLSDPSNPAQAEVLLNRELLRHGYARCTEFRHGRMEEFRGLEDYSRRVRAGLWARNAIP